MTYRSDHEAALMRVEALEHEVARLRTAAPPVATRPETKSRAGASAIRAAIALALVGAGVVAIVARDRPVVVAAPAPVMVEQPQPLRGIDHLRDCIAGIAAARQADATTTDPRGAAESTDWVASTGARCRDDLRELANGPIDSDLRFRIRQLADAEDKLADPISMITVYYGNNPYQLDNYESAPQLWREYHRARAARDDVLAGLRPALAY